MVCPFLVWFFSFSSITIESHKGKINPLKLFLSLEDFIAQLLCAAVVLEASRAICAVHNSDHPIPPEDQARIFEPFYRATANSHSSIGGWGLGLSICKEIVEQHEGEIWVKSSELDGTTFFVSLPCSSTT
jgi:signal transduction histidine kinase